MTRINEQSQHDFLVTHTEMATGVNSLLPEIDKLAHDPPDRDLALLSFYPVAKKIFTDKTVSWHDTISDIVDTSLHNRTNKIPAQVATNTLQRAMQWIARIEDPDCFQKETYKSEAGWYRLFELVSKDQVYQALLRKTMTEFTIQSMLERRFLSHRMLMLSEIERIGAAASYLEVGSSGQFGQKYLSSNLPAHPIDVVYLPDEAIRLSPDERKKAVAQHPYLTRFLRNYVKRELTLGTNWGVDRVPLDDETREWQYHCSNRPNEFNDPIKQATWNQLAYADVPGVNFYNAEFSKRGMKDFRAVSGMDHFKIVTFPTMLHQVDPDLLQETIELGQEYVDPNDGYLLIQDFAMVSLQYPDRPQFFANWHKEWGTYRLLLADPREDFKKLHEIAVFDGGRANQMMFGRDIGKLAMIADLGAVVRKDPAEAAHWFQLGRDRALYY